MATLEEIQLLPVSLRLRVVFQSPNVLLSSPFICGTARPDALQIVHKVQLGNYCRELQHI